ncbi:MAG: hypothetical protein ACOZNI_19805 [Myxococcota bacterium]
MPSLPENLHEAIERFLAAGEDATRAMDRMTAAMTAGDLASMETALAQMRAAYVRLRAAREEIGRLDRV